MCKPVEAAKLRLQEFNLSVASLIAHHPDPDLRGFLFQFQEPKNVQELTSFIQGMLQQMQDRFQSMSDQV